MELNSTCEPSVTTGESVSEGHATDDQPFYMDADEIMELDEAAMKECPNDPVFKAWESTCLINTSVTLKHEQISPDELMASIEDDGEVDNGESFEEYTQNNTQRRLEFHVSTI